MTGDQDRIAIPTNGKGPHSVPAPVSVSSVNAPSSPTGAPTQEELSTAISPRQLAVGFGILASLLLLLAGLARRRRSEPDDA